MGVLDKLLGRDGQRRPTAAQGPGPGSTSDDARALDRYRYMLETAPPETIEQAHAEAFAKLTPEQRSLLLQQLSANSPEAERAAALAGKDDPQSLARLATRAEVRQPGALERTFGGMGGRGMGMGGMMAGSFLSTMAGVVVGSAIAQSFLGDSGGEAGANEAASDTSADADGDAGDFDGGDFGEI